MKWYGHPRFYDLIREEIELHSRKNYDYAVGGDPLGNFRRVADILSHYPNLDLKKPAVVAMVYMMKQMDAILWYMNQGHNLSSESVYDKLRDISIYSKLMSILMWEEMDGKEKKESEGLSCRKAHR